MIGIIDCGGANLQSIKSSLDSLNIDSITSNDWSILQDCNGYIIPGVGAAKNVMDTLHIKSLVKRIKRINKPVLGICIGMQILYDYSEEDDQKCLSIIRGKVKKFNDSGLAVPQMGWNKVNFNKDHNFLDGYYYFANSYYADPSEYTLGKSNYGVQISSFIKKDNFYGVQFHPEKSSKQGKKFLKFFLDQL